ncbi:PREDICTED: vespryn-like [Gekko japonicus]|uniref:Vespryn-like n=1 Tax=Gekko japonicus TaxID=146911 RepID=A0ABM1L3C8_GEKJA|nr:PREDICTED: vespryn-like [Gekko japonicus]
MPRSVDSHLSFWDFPLTNRGLQTFRGLFFILWLSICLLAECEGTKKDLESKVRSLKKKYGTKVTFNPLTAYKGLTVSTDKTYVESGGRNPDVPDNAERFSRNRALLGLPGFTSGKHYWEVEFGDQREWAVGVALERVARKVHLKLVPEEGIWQEGLWWFLALENRSQTVPVRPGIIGVFLNYEAGKVTFYIEGKVIPKRASFNGQKVVPFFYVGRHQHLKLKQ